MGGKTKVEKRQHLEKRGQISARRERRHRGLRKNSRSLRHVLDQQSRTYGTHVHSLRSTFSCIICARSAFISLEPYSGDQFTAKRILIRDARILDIRRGRRRRSY